MYRGLRGSPPRSNQSRSAKETGTLPSRSTRFSGEMRDRDFLFLPPLHPKIWTGKLEILPTAFLCKAFPTIPIVSLLEATLATQNERENEEKRKAYSSGNPDAGAPSPALPSRNFYDVSGGRGLSRLVAGGSKTFFYLACASGSPPDLCKSSYLQSSEPTTPTKLQYNIPHIHISRVDSKGLAVFSSRLN